MESLSPGLLKNGKMNLCMSTGSRENKQNKVRTQLWNTLYIYNYYDSKLLSLFIQISDIFTIPNTWFRRIWTQRISACLLGLFSWKRSPPSSTFSKRKTQMSNVFCPMVASSISKQHSSSSKHVTMSTPRSTPMPSSSSKLLKLSKPRSASFSA